MKEKNKPEPNKIYALTGVKDSKCIANGYSWAESEVKKDKNKVLEIGATWIGREFQGSGLNKNMKFLMLQYAFETLNFQKVEFRIDERNTRSRKAVEKIGATLEGVLRQNVYLLNGFKRSTCCYGILLVEWKNSKETVFKGLNYKSFL
mgnify:CR=1 FL=1